MKIAVLGGGNGSFAAAGDFALQGHDVRLWRRDAAQVAEHRAAGSRIILKDSNGRHDVRLALVTTDIAEAISDAELILCPAPAFAQPDIARLIAPDLGPQGRLAVLLHDAPEYVIGDMISPFKALLGADYRTVEARLLTAIQRRFGLQPPLSAKLLAWIKAADHIAAYYEAIRLAGFGEAEAVKYFGRPKGVDPAKAIQQTKVDTTMRFVLPYGNRDE